MKLLALETATEACSVALWLDGEVLERFEVVPRRHAELVLPWVEALLAEAGLARSQLDAVACGRGPGAFTGVRLAVAMTQGLGLGLDRPVLGISTLEALALPALRDLGAPGEAGSAVLAAIDARMGEVYCAAWQPDPGGGWQAHLPEAVLAPGAVNVPGAQPLIGLGTGFGAAESALVHRLGNRLVRVDASALPRAADVARLAAEALAGGAGLDPQDLEPAYLRNKVALTLRERGKPAPEPP